MNRALALAVLVAAVPFENAIDAGALDPAAFAEWVDGAERPVVSKRGPAHVVYTATSQIEWQGLRYGESKTPGARHLRVGFKASVKIGSVLTRAGGRLSVLKADAPYPGDLQKDDLWIPAERTGPGEPGDDEFALWVLPPGTSTRALRFTHDAKPADPVYSGYLGGVVALAERFANVAPQAVAITRARNEAAAKLNNGTNDGTWGAWDNGKEGAAVEISKENPETILLAWPAPVTLRGLNALWAGFGAAEVQSFAGPADRHPREAPDGDWQTIATAEKIQHGYPGPFVPNWIDFGKAVTTRAIRLRVTQVAAESHPHMNGNTKKGKRIWLGELQALQPLGDAPLKSAILALAADLHAPIGVKFILKEAGLVTLVIEDAAGKRVRNLVSETPFPAGENTAWWDGMDDLLRDNEAARHGIYRIPSQFVQPGTYTVRGLTRKPIELHYEFSGYNSGTPPWPTPDHTGGWTTNHTPPQSALFVPGPKPMVYLGSYVAEGGDGLAWVDLDGRKQGGKGWVGGTWTGAPYLAYDAATDAITVGSAWEGELRLTAIAPGGAEKPVLKQKFEGGKDSLAMTGLAARNGLLVCSLPKQKQLLFVDAKAMKVLGNAAMDDPRGLAFDGEGRLLVLAGKKLQRFMVTDAKLWEPKTVVEGLEDPQHVTLDSDGNLYVSDRGASHQVKVFSAEGKPLRAIGVAGAPKAGPYDPNHMNNPCGIAVDSNRHLWVTENDYQPKRVSVWSLDGKLLRAVNGPAEYGGGGKIDPKDKTRFYYHGMEFRLDWEKGTSTLVRVLYRPGPDDLQLPGHHAGGQPEEPFYVEGRRYFTNCYNSNPTNGASVAMIWLDVQGIAVPVAGFGRASDWDVLKPLRPAGSEKKPAIFSWSDVNGDGRVQPDEVAFDSKSSGGITVMPDLAIVASRIDGSAVRFAPKRFTEKGVPVYDLAAGEVRVPGAQGPSSSGGDQALVAENGWTVLTVGPKPFAAQSMGGAFKGEARWSYPSPWPGLHASHESPPPDRPGQLIGTTRLLGGFVTPTTGDAGPLWAVNGNQGNMYVFTADGLFVAQLFRDVRQGRPWAMPQAVRDMNVTNLTLHDENFWPSITQTSDGKIYLVDGANTCIVRVDGLETILRLSVGERTVTADDLARARAYFIDREAERQGAQGRGILKVALRKDAPVVDGKADDWAGAEWVDVDKSGVPAYFNSDSKPHDVTAAVCVANGRLYAFFRTGEKDLLRNSGEVANAPFKTGGALDLMIGTNPKADSKRERPAAGDLRLLVTKAKGKTLALLYRAVVSGAKEPVPFSSPWRTITFDRVDDVSGDVELAGGADGNYELSIPLEKLGLKPAAGDSIRGDIGLLRGDGAQTLHRVYWCNKATGITADVPSEAELTPRLWGTWEFR
jgi:hypothetical protein